MKIEFHYHTRNKLNFQVDHQGDLCETRVCFDQSNTIKIAFPTKTVRMVFYEPGGNQNVYETGVSFLVFG